MGFGGGEWENNWRKRGGGGEVGRKNWIQLKIRDVN